MQRHADTETVDPWLFFLARNRRAWHICVLVCSFLAVTRNSLGLCLHIKKKLVAFHKVPRTSGCALRPVFVCFLHQCYNKIAFHLLVMRQWSWLGWWMKWWVTLGATCIWSIAAVTILLTIVPALKSVLYRLILGLFMFTIISSYSQGWQSWSAWLLQLCLHQIFF